MKRILNISEFAAELAAMGAPKKKAGENVGFHCAICEKFVNMGWRRNRHGQPGYPFPPVCVVCERDYRTAKVATGAFMDRRKIQHIGALAEALRGEASHQHWRQTHGVNYGGA